MATKRKDLLADYQKTQQQLVASEKRGRKAIQRMRQLDKLLESVKPKMELWADSPLSDEANAARVMTVGECRKILAILDEKEAA